VALALQIFLPAHAAGFDVSMLQFVAGATGADIAFVFDTTGSMWDEIDAAKAQATQLAQEWLTFFPNGRVALVEYKDHGDPFVARVDLGLTNVVADFQSAVNALTASGGGDTPEAVNSALMAALNGLDWRDGAIKTAIVITDASGKDPEPITGFTRDQVVQRSLEIDPVAIYAVNVAGFTDVTDWFTPLASATAGEVLVLQPGQTLADALFAVLETVHYSPVATMNGPYIAQTGTPIRFRTTGSFDADAALASYEWDFNGDGTVDQATTSPEVEYTYPGEFHGLAAVRVISSDGGSALATAQVTVDSVGLGNLLPLAPLSAAASITGATEATVTWTPATNDRADVYKVFLADGTQVGLRLASDPHSAVVSGLDLNQPVVFKVLSANGYGNSGAVASPPAGGASWSSSVRVNNDTGTTQQDRPAIALGPDGATYLIWDDYRPGTQADIYFSRRNPSTGVWSANQKVNNDTAGRSQWSAAIAVDGSNNAYAVWEDTRNGTSKNQDWDIYFSKRSSATGTWSANVRVNSDNQGAPMQFSPRIAVKSDGAAVAAWVDRRSNQWNIYAARLAAGASTWGANTRVTTNTTSRKDDPDVVVGADGTAYAVWEDDRQSGNYDIWFSKLLPGSSTWTPEVRISDDLGTAAQYGARIGIDSGGNLMVVWLDDRPYPATQVRMSRLPAGSSTWPASVVVSDAPAVPVALALAVKPDGNAFAVWQDGRGPSYDIWGTYYSAASSAWTVPALVSDDPATTAQMRPTVAVNGSEIAVAWTDLRNGNPDIYTRRRTPS